MATILYTLINNEVVEEMHDAVDVERLLKSGYSTSPDGLCSTGVSYDEVKAQAKEAGIKIGRKSIDTLKKELGI